MTDARITECAKAMREQVGIVQDPLRGALDTRAFLDGLPKPAIEALARACILKWLEQPQTHAMQSVGYAEACNHDYGDTVPSELIAPATYKAMCAQAAKEIGE